MTRSIFDPTGGETEHSGSQNLGPDASEISHMPPGMASRDHDSDEDDTVIDMNPQDTTSQDISTQDISTQADEADAPQETDAMDDPDLLMEGQPTDDSDAPQESSE